ncbi:MAG: glycosyltransferase family 4 protein [Chitinophagaceae bacterium]
MKIAFITRSTLFKVPGGDTVQVMQLARQMRQSGIAADIVLTNQAINYSGYDLFHFSNITRPADILFHIPRLKKPFIVSPILIEYGEYDRYYRGGISGLILKKFKQHTNEYIKTLSRWIKGSDILRSKKYLWKGQQKSIREIIRKAAMLMPGTEAEYRRIKELFGLEKEYVVVPNGIDSSVFHADSIAEKDNQLVLCAARIEGIKNQLNLVKALNNTRYTLLLIGSPAPNQKEYYEECKRIAAGNVHFYNHVPQEILTGYYRAAKVHVLPSWFETCGLSSLEAAAMGCNIAITDKGYTREYFGNDAFYCDPGNPKSIFEAVDKAARSEPSKRLQEKVINNYTWQKAASITLETCKNIIYG